MEGLKEEFIVALTQVREKFNSCKRKLDLIDYRKYMKESSNLKLYHSRGSTSESIIFKNGKSIDYHYCISINFIESERCLRCVDFRNVDLSDPYYIGELVYFLMEND